MRLQHICTHPYALYIHDTYTTCTTAIKIPAEPTTRNLFICTLTHGGSTEPTLPMARRKLRPIREKEKRNSPDIHLCSQPNHCPKGRTSYIRIFETGWTGVVPLPSSSKYFAKSNFIRSQPHIDCQAQLLNFLPKKRRMYAGLDNFTSITMMNNG